MAATFGGYLSTGCGDECPRNAARCNDNAAEFCGSSASSPFTEWSSTPCGNGYCQLSNSAREPEPFCSTTNAPDPRCAPDGDSGFCVGDTSYGCHQGFVESWVNCKTGDSYDPHHQQISKAGYCGSKGFWAQCVSEPEPDPGCQSLSAFEGYACRGNQLLTCSHGYVTAIKQCPPTGTCVEGPYPFCSTAKAADPDCPPEPQSEFCRNDTLYICYSGWTTGEQACRAGTTCSPDSGAFCVTKSK